MSQQPQANQQALQPKKPRTEVIVALIGAAAVIIAAIVSGIFVLVGKASPPSGSASPPPVVTSSSAQTSTTTTNGFRTFSNAKVNISLNYPAQWAILAVGDTDTASGVTVGLEQPDIGFALEHVTNYGAATDHIHGTSQLIQLDLGQFSHTGTNLRSTPPILKQRTFAGVVWTNKMNYTIIIMVLRIM